MNSEVRLMTRDLLDIADDYRWALEGFNPGPQELTGRRVVFEDDETLSKFKGLDPKTKRHQVTLTISDKHEAFREYDRVRISLIRVWLEGVELQPGQTVTVNISTCRDFKDRLGKETFSFVAKPLIRSFQFANDRRILVDGKFAQEIKSEYYQPTPFTDWEISMDSNSGVSLDSLTSIVLEFTGDVIVRSGHQEAVRE